MAGNTQRIDDLVDLAEIEKQMSVAKQLSIDLTQQYVANFKAANDLNSAISKVGNNSQFKKAATEAEAATQKLVANQTKLTKAEAERIRLEEKRKRIVSENTQAELKAAQANNSVTETINKQNKALSDQANKATAATAANQRYGNTVKSTASQISSATTEASKNLETTAVTATKATNYFTKAFSVIRQAAYLLPGIGISGIFSLGITGVVELINALSNLEKQEQDLIVKSRDLREAIGGGEYQQAVKNVTELKTNIDLAKQGFISKEGVVKQYNETIGKTTGLVSSLDEAEKALAKNGDQYIKYTLYKAAAQLALNEAAKKALEAAKEEQRHVGRAIYGNREQRAEAYKDVPFLVRLKDAFTQTSDALDEYNKKTVDSNKKAAEQQTNIAEDFQKKAAEIAKGFNFNFFDDNKPDKKKKDTTAEDELRALEYQYNQQIELARELDKENLALAEEYLKQIEAARKAAQERALNNEKISAAERLLILDKDKQDVLSALADQYSKGLISTAAYEQQKKEIEYQYQVDAVQNAIDLAQELINVKKAFGEDTTNDELELAKLQMKLSEQVTNKKLTDLDKQMARQKEVNAAIKNLAEEAANFVIALVDAGFTNRKNALRAEQDQLEERTAQEIAAVDRSLGTEQQKADKIAVINAKAQAEKDKIAKQQRAIDVEKAKFDKAVAIARIIENTAIGITSALAQFPPNVPLSILIGALGAVQLGTVLAQPIPQYAKGTKNAKGGLSIVGEQGRELIETPSGKSFLSAGTASLINLPAGSKVTPHHETMRMIGRPENLAGYKDREEVPWREVIAAIERNKPTKQGNKINVNVDAGFYIYRENHFR